MPQLIDPADLPYCAADTHACAADWLKRQRDRLTLLLDEIALEVTTALEEASLSMPIFLMVPSSGDAVLTFATPLDPSDEDWSRACQIVSGISSNKIDVAELRIRELPCAASGVATGAADLR